MRKRGQITIYIIIGLVLLIAIILLFYIRSSITGVEQELKISEVSSVPEQLESVKEDIKLCVYDFVEDSIYYMSYQGGVLDEEGVSFAGRNIPYLIKNKENLLPEIPKMNDEFSKYINENLPLACSGYENTEFSDVFSRVDIKEDNVIVTVDWSIRLEKGDISGTIEQFNLEYNIRLGEIRGVVNKIIENQIRYYPRLCITCIAEIALGKDTLVERYIENETQIFLIKDNADENLIYGYAVNYGG